MNNRFINESEALNRKGGGEKSAASKRISAKPSAAQQRSSRGSRSLSSGSTKSASTKSASTKGDATKKVAKNSTTKPTQTRKKTNSSPFKSNTTVAPHDANRKKGGGVPNKKEPTSKNEEQLEGIKNKSNKERKRYAYGALFLAVSLYLLIAIISYFFFWRFDQSLNTFAQVIDLTSGEVKNVGGKFGAILADFLVGRCCGVGAVCFPMFWLAFSMVLLKVNIIFFRRSLISLISLMFISSFAATLFFPSMNGIFGSSLGGEFGLYINKWLVNFIGEAGAMITIVTLIIIWLIYTSLTIVKYLGDSIKKLFALIYAVILYIFSLFDGSRNNKNSQEVLQNQDDLLNDDNSTSDVYEIETSPLPDDAYVHFGAGSVKLNSNDKSDEATESDNFDDLRDNLFKDDELVLVDSNEKEEVETDAGDNKLGSVDGAIANFEKSDEHVLVAMEGSEKTVETQPDFEIVQRNNQEDLVEDKLTCVESIIPDKEGEMLIDQMDIKPKGGGDFIMMDDIDMDDLECMVGSAVTIPKVQVNRFESHSNDRNGYTSAEKISKDAFEVAITSNAEIDIASLPGDEDVRIVTNHTEEIDSVDTSVFDPTLELSTYKLPPVELLDNHTQRVVVTEQELFENKNRIIETLANFNIAIDKIKATIGPTVTLYEIKPAAGVRISKIKNLEDDIALSLSALGIRIIAPIPGKGTIGIEVPNKNKETVSMYSVVKSAKFQDSDYDLPIVLGRTIQNDDFVVDLAKMPHLLVAGATGQGKSVGLNAIITSLLYKKHPSELKLVLVDPKKVELTLYQSIDNHFLAKMEDEEEAIITDTQRVVYTLNSLCIEMDDRYKLLKAAKVRNIKEYNGKFVNRKLNPNNGHRFLPYFVVIIDEFADLIMTAGREIETPIARIAQLARAVGIHLVIATQRPTTNIITGVIKANFPARIAFKVSSMIDSRTILDGPGANQLIGRGDMLVSTGNEITRVQCAFIDTPEVERITDYIGAQRGYGSPYILPEFTPEGDSKGGEPKFSSSAKRDEKFNEVARYVVQNQQGSASTIQRNFSIGFNRAGRLMDQLERTGIVGKQEGSRPRQVLISDMSSLEMKLIDMESENI